MTEQKYTLFNNVNRFCLDRIAKASETRPMVASEDIVDERGIKLWGKGQPVSRDLQERLLSRKLQRPLESSLDVEKPITFSDIIQKSRTLIEENSLLGRIAGRSAMGRLESLRAFPIPAPVRLLLTSADENGGRTFEHTLATILVCAGIAERLRASDRDVQMLMVSALLHDLGEMYINPDILASSYKLGPHEWKHVAMHPRVGQLLVEQLTTLPRTIGQIIVEHHERHDGSGYPNQMSRDKQHALSGWLAVADASAAILSRGDAGAAKRVALALRVVPEEFDRDAVAAVMQSVQHENDAYVEDQQVSVALIQRVWNQLEHTIELAHALTKKTPSGFGNAVAVLTEGVLENLQKSIRSTGIYDLAAIEAFADDQELIAEITLIVKEVQWRMRNLARNLHLRLEQQDNGTLLPIFDELIASLDIRFQSCANDDRAESVVVA